MIPRQAPLVRPVRVRREEAVDRVEDRLGRRPEVREAVSHAARDQQPVRAPRAQDQTLEGEGRAGRLVVPEVHQADQQRRVRGHDEEIVLLHVHVPGLHGARLQEAPVPLDRPERLESLDATPLVDPRDLGEQAVGAARDGHLRETSPPL